MKINSDEMDGDKMRQFNLKLIWNAWQQGKKKHMSLKKKKKTGLNKSLKYELPK